MSAGIGSGLDGGKPLWRVFYESADITITSWYVEVDGARVAVHELLGTTRCLTYRYPLVRSAAVAAGLELAIAVPFAVAYGSATMLCAGLVSACGAAVAAWGDSRRNPRYLELRATVRGRRVVLFGTRDKREFGQVWRALVRAAEDSRQSVPWALEAARERYGRVGSR